MFRRFALLGNFRRERCPAQSSLATHKVLPGNAPDAGPIHIEVELMAIDLVHDNHNAPRIRCSIAYLPKTLHVSSKLDVETEEHLRFAPDPLKVTMPLMSFVTDRAAVAMTWTDMELQPVYATPDFFDGTGDHRMALRGRKIEATIYVDEVGLEETVYWAVKKKGLPPLPKPPRSPQQQREICLAALGGPLRTDAGWGHCVQERWECLSRFFFCPGQISAAKSRTPQRDLYCFTPTSTGSGAASPSRHLMNGRPCHQRPGMNPRRLSGVTSRHFSSLL